MADRCVLFSRYRRVQFENVQEIVRGSFDVGTALRLGNSVAVTHCESTELQQHSILLLKCLYFSNIKCIEIFKYPKKCTILRGDNLFLKSLFLHPYTCLHV